MMMLDKAVVERFKFGVSHQFYGWLSKIGKLSHNWCLINADDRDRTITFLIVDLKHGGR